MTDTLPIQLAVASHYGISLAELRSRDRTARVAWPRQVAMYFVSRLTGMNLTNVGKLFERKSWTVTHAIKHVKDMMDTDSNVRMNIAFLDRKLGREYTVNKSGEKAEGFSSTGPNVTGDYKA